ncbi:hypothetical protein CVT26_012965 [Gymnopilus dilepis]|uniref:Uncharacterized protein n=1 Tax=Gymnopilus dilepis TaxID=231916 RepID=A0A409WD75_9AGAR|nr:hypothetical protein CVT26_012965 [Gymnopilus dilepis]
MLDTRACHECHIKGRRVGVVNSPSDDPSQNSDKAWRNKRFHTWLRRPYFEIEKALRWQGFSGVARRRNKRVRLSCRATSTASEEGEKAPSQANYSSIQFTGCCLTPS